jgi:transcriptional regulator with XRE-family HTH domain
LNDNAKDQAMVADDLTSMSIGERVRYWRERRGMYQAALAGRVGKSKSWLCQIENGTRLLDSFSDILDLAGVLRVNPWELTGHRGDLAPDGQRMHPAVPGIRAALDAVPSMHPDPETEPSVFALAGRVRSVWDAWLTDPSCFDETGRLLPGLLADVQTSVRFLDGAEQRQARRQLAMVYQLIRMFTKRVGSQRDSLRAADRAVMAAEETGDMPLLGASIWALAVAHSAMGEVEQADEVARRGVQLLRPDLPDATPEHMSMWGQLHLIRAVSLARTRGRDKADVWECIDTAGRAAERNGERNDYWTAFGPTNVHMHAVDAAVEMGEPANALSIAREVDSTRVPSVERRFSHETEIASIYAQRREFEACLAALLRAEEISPHNSRYSISVREMTRVLLRHANRLTHRAQARGLAQRLGVLEIA